MQTPSASTGRPRVRTERVSTALRERLLNAFGTLWNAYRQLSLDAVGISFPTFNRACRDLPVAPETAAAIQIAWDARRVRPVAA